MSDINNMILRTVYLTPEIDSLLRTRAFRADISKNELIRQYLEAAIKADKNANTREKNDAEAAHTGLAQYFADGYAKKKVKNSPAKKKPFKKITANRLSSTAKKAAPSKGPRTLHAMKK
jgi:hypothetical protein